MKTNFFVFHAEPRRFSPGQDESHPYEIQLVNEFGVAIAWGFVGDDETTLLIQDVNVPESVIQAARRQPLGKGDYVDENGNHVAPKNLWRRLKE